MFKILTFIVTSFFLHSCSTFSIRTPQEEKTNYNIHEAKTEIEEFFKDRNLKNIGYAFFSATDRTVWGTLGSASPNARFKVGSVTKVFTAIAIFQLREKGLLDLDDPVSRYIPEFSNVRNIGSPSEPTIRDLLFHNSGLQGEVLGKL